MVFKVLFALIVGSFSSAYGDSPKVELFACSTFPATTTFMAGTQGEEMIVRMINHNGVELAPALSGVFTPYDLPKLNERAQSVRKLKDDMSFRFVNSTCRTGKDFTFLCFGVRDIETVNGAKIETLSASLTKQTIETVDAAYTGYIFRLSLRIDGRDLVIEMPYSQGECALFPM